MSFKVMFDQLLFEGKTASGTVGAFPESLQGQYMEFTLYVKFDHTSAAGVVTLETAIDPSDADTWASIGTVTWAAIDKTHYVSVTGVFKALRARISTAVTSGTCKAWIIGAASN